MFLRDWLKTLLALTVLLGIVEMLLPPGDIGKFSKLVLGLVVMLAVLQPLTLFLQPHLELPSLGLMKLISSEEELVVLADELRLAGVKPFLEVENGGTLPQLEAVLLTLEQFENVQVRMEGSSPSNQRVVVKIDPKTPSLEGQVRKIVSGLLNLKEHQILVESWNN